MKGNQEKEFHKVISKTLLTIAKKQDIGMNNILTILLFWDLILIKHCIRPGKTLTAFLELQLNLLQPSIDKSLITDGLDDQYATFLENNGSVLRELFVTIWATKQITTVSIFKLWERECVKMFGHLKIKEEECLTYLIMLHEHFGLSDKEIVQFLKLIHHICHQETVMVPNIVLQQE